MATPAGSWITTTEAAQRLGVKRSTLYAYVSRGLLRSERRPGQQESLFDRAQIDAMATSTRPPGGPPPVLRFRSIATTVSSQAEGELFYRGRSLVEVVALDSLELAAAVVLDTTPPASAGPLPAAVTLDLGRLPLPRRMPVAVQLLAAADPFAGDTDPERVRAAAVPTLRTALLLLAGAIPGHPAYGDDLAALALAALGGRPDEPGDVEVLRVLLVALLDHGLTASTVAARVAASTRAGLPDCLCAAYAAMSGPLHGAAPVAAHALLTDGPDPATLVARALRSGGSVAGFGHFLYPDGDPRADVVLEALWRRPGTADLRQRVESLSALVSQRTGTLPNVDLASAAVLHALGLPAESGEAVFQIARSVGVAAHVVEEYAEEPLRWRGRDPQG
ncbi:citrate synthase [Terrabacter sp. NPDC080008]|uniref:citrate synthase n=1 Tax=Terrabacter sp. NPDC080008 TaxID=3155176 RepID=UPI00344D12AC